MKDRVLITEVTDYLTMLSKTSFSLLVFGCLTCLCLSTVASKCLAMLSLTANVRPQATVFSEYPLRCYYVRSLFNEDRILGGNL
jgi:hypothetical protein